jgi:osmoprotectant transport system permease protein
MKKRPWLRIVAVFAVLLVPAGPALAQAIQVWVGSKAFTESVILGEIVRLFCEAHGYPTQHKGDLGGSPMLWAALKKGEIDLYPEYTGTLRKELLKGENVPDDESLKKALAPHGIGLLGRLGFDDSYALGMREDLAERLKIRNISDLAKPEHKGLRLGFSEEFKDRPDGWPNLVERYRLPQKAGMPMLHSVALRGLVQGKVDVIDLYTTDAENRQYGLRVLHDDLRAFPAYDAVLIYRLDLQKRAPELVKALHKLVNKIDTKKMIALNSKVLIDRKSEGLTAAEFLNEDLGLGIDLTPFQASPWRRILERFWQNTRQHLFLVAVSLALAVLIAVPLGVVSYKVPALGQPILGTVGVIQTLPSMALLVFMIPLLGVGAWPAITALFLYSLLPIVRNTYQGLVEIPTGLRESAEVLGLPPRARLWQVELPMASRSILTGIKIAAVINVGTATIGALIAAGGYGEPILTGIRLNDVGLILQGAVPAAVLALLVQGLFGLAERWVVPRGLRLQSA